MKNKALLKNIEQQKIFINDMRERQRVKQRAIRIKAKEKSRGKYDQNRFQ